MNTITSFSSISSKTFSEYKKNFATYTKLALIIFGFGILDQLLDQNPLQLVLLLLNIYLTSCAAISIIYKAYNSCVGYNLTISESWDYARNKFWRYFGASILVAIPSFFVFLIIYFSLLDNGLNTKDFVFVGILLLIDLIVTTKMFLYPYIAILTESEVEYIPISHSIIKGNFLKVLVAFLIYLIPIIIDLVFLFINRNNLDSMLNIFENTTYLLLIFRLFSEPLLYCFITRLIYDSGFHIDFYAPKEEEIILEGSALDQNPDLNIDTQSDNLIELDSNKNS